MKRQSRMNRTSAMNDTSLDVGSALWRSLQSDCGCSPLAPSQPSILLSAPRTVHKGSLLESKDQGCGLWEVSMSTNLQGPLCHWQAPCCTGLGTRLLHLENTASFALGLSPSLSPWGCKCTITGGKLNAAYENSSPQEPRTTNTF